MCIGNCDECKSQCGVRLYKNLIQKCIGSRESELKDQEVKKEDGAMSDAVGGCHAGTEEKIGRLDERVNTCRRIAVVSLAVAVIAGVLAVWLLAKL